MKKFFLILTLLIFSGILTGCSSPSLISADDKGLLKSIDFGEKWQAINNILDKEQQKNEIKDLNISVLKQDRLNNQYIYAGSQGKGIFYSHDAGAAWKNILKNKNIFDLALDPQNNGVVYASTGKNLVKTIDAGEKWKIIFSENRKNVSIMAVSIVQDNNLELYIGTSEGEVYKTNDGGESWKLVLDTDDEIREIKINPKNTSIVYVGCLFDGIFKTVDAGKTWKALQDIYYGQLKESLRSMQGLKIYRGLVFDPVGTDNIIFASDVGLLRSVDGGVHWKILPTLIPNDRRPNSFKIKSLTINPNNNKNIYFGTENELYRTFDGGKTWLASNLPTSQMANEIVIDWKNDNVVFMGLGGIIKP